MRALVVLILVTASIEAQADAKAGEKKAQLCLLCHKPARVGVPLLEAQPEKYLVAATNAYKTSKRVDPAMQMQPNVAALSDRDIRDIASYFASRPPIVDAFRADAQRVAAGQKLVEDSNCAACHGARFSGGILSLDSRDSPRVILSTNSKPLPHLGAYILRRTCQPAIEPISRRSRST